MDAADTAGTVRRVEKRIAHSEHVRGGANHWNYDALGAGFESAARRSP
jgi:hypothetical protein